MIGKFEPSSKICRVCGYNNCELKLKDREWKCPDFKTKRYRGINAAINIKKIHSLIKIQLGSETLRMQGMGLGTYSQKKEDRTKKLLSLQLSGSPWESTT